MIGSVGYHRVMRAPSLLFVALLAWGCGDDDGAPPVDAGRDLAAHARALFAEVGLERELKDARADDGPAAARRWDNVEFVLGALDRYEKSPNPDKP